MNINAVDATLTEAQVQQAILFSMQIPALQDEVATIKSKLDTLYERVQAIPKFNIAGGVDGNVIVLSKQ